MALVALGVSGGIGAYKAVEVVRGLQKHGHDVVAIMTRAATRFVRPLTFEAITRRPVITSQWTPGMNANIEHIALASEAAVLLVAPATANIIGKFANGIADDFLTSFYLATKAPVLLAPAMNTHMLEHPAVQANLRTLAAHGVRFVEPGRGYLACGWVGKGRLAEPDEIVAAVERVLVPESPLRGLRVLVTAGPTYEDLDPVRYIGNRSSGRMGLALAEEAVRRGAQVTVVLGPTRLEPAPGSEVIRVRSAAQMHGAVTAHAEAADVVIMAAAVADYTPETAEPLKVAKQDGPLTITLARTRDILADLGSLPRRRAAGKPLLVGFAAETHDVLAHARAKLERKHVDLIVANDVSRADSGFEVETNAVTLVGAAGDEVLPVQSKHAVAAAILDRVEAMLAAGPAAQRL